MNCAIAPTQKKTRRRDQQIARMVKILLLRGFTPGPTGALYRSGQHSILDPDVPMPNTGSVCRGNRYAYQWFAVCICSLGIICYSLYNKIYALALFAFFIGAFLAVRLKRKVVDHCVQQGTDIYEASIKSFQPDVLVSSLSCFLSCHGSKWFVTVGCGAVRLLIPGEELRYIGSCRKVSRP